MPPSKILSSSASTNAGSAHRPLYTTRRIDVPDIEVVFQHHSLDSRNDSETRSGVKHLVHSSAGGWASPSTVNPAQ